MAKTVVGLFENATNAQRAIQELISNGFSRDDISITSSHDYSGTERSQSSTYDNDEGIGDKISNFFSSLFGTDEDSRYYSDAVRRGSTVVTVDADSEELASRAADILDNYGTVDIDRDAQYSTAYAGAGYTNTGYTEEGTSIDRDSYRSDLNEEGRVAIPVVEEELQVGKRQVEQGGVQVRSRIIERPVEEMVRLREERVNVERRPVNRAITDADLAAFKEGTIEISEMAEEAVVNKQARVVEEVVVNKEVIDRDETIRDTVRSTDVDIKETGRRSKTQAG
jgi:uncharacterized protein (TIGR02271 family)